MLSLKGNMFAIVFGALKATFNSTLSKFVLTRVVSLLAKSSTLVLQYGRVMYLVCFSGSNSILGKLGCSWLLLFSSDSIIVLSKSFVVGGCSSRGVLLRMNLSIDLKLSQFTAQQHKVHHKNGTQQQNTISRYMHHKEEQPSFNKHISQTYFHRHLSQLDQPNI